MHRGVYAIAEEATRRYEEARHAVGRFIGAPRPGTRDRLHEERHRGLQPRRPLLGAPPLAEGDVVLLTELEHHANLVPWLMLAAERGIELRYIPLGEDYRLDLSGSTP